MENQSLVFYPGQILAGTVLLQLEEPCTAREVTLYLRGKAKNHWTKTRSYSGANGTRHTTTDHYDSRIVIIDESIRLWGDGKKDKIPTGNYEFPFSFRLPISCLPSFEGEYGHIRYELKVEIDRPWRFDEEATCPFTVVTVCDLNLFPYAKEPAFHVVCEKTGLPIFRRGDVGVEVYMPKQGFVPGETIPVKITISNESSKDMESIELVLREYVDYAAFHPGSDFPVNALYTESACGSSLKEHRRDVANVEMPVKLDAHSEGSFTVNLVIPPIVASFQCAITRVYYMLKVAASTEATFNSKVKLKMPLMIGTIPFREDPPPPLDSPPAYPSAHPDPQPFLQPGFIRDAPQFAPQPSNNNPSAPPAEESTEATAPPLSPPAGPPPSYQESIFGPTAPEGERRPFAPRFPFYPHLSIDSLKIEK
ncbi:unnamed protein product, partial [Mesorhabditis belari]|uniref:Arrestin C-terminal-like domain-containing protein n=1 Tax=Mesorhabditis belari TaxID=2138241 RepID=A0AAF3E7W8_9BILA